HDTAGCADSTCEAMVCDVEPYCCEEDWYPYCAAQAAILCGDLCSFKLHLQPGSPCIDAGDNTAVPEGITTDLDGNRRFHDDPGTPDTGNPDGINPIVDMGAYEFQGTSCPCDCETPPDGTVDVGDFLALLAQWGNPGTCDCEDPPDGTVDVGDFLAILSAWGPCS
ncbi:MAG: choice-of-anchor Q domain-containing protein, partial [Planctomycetota bacterium]